MCNHEHKNLVGTADGIMCTACGKVFKDFAELERDRNPDEKTEEKVEKKKRTAKK